MTRARVLFAGLSVLLTVSLAMQPRQDPAAAAIEKKILGWIRQRIELAEHAVDQFTISRDHALGLRRAGRSSQTSVDEFEAQLDAAKDRVVELEIELAETEGRFSGEPQHDKILELLEAKLKRLPARIDRLGKARDTARTLFEAGRGGADVVIRADAELLRVRDDEFATRQKIEEVKLAQRTK